MKKLIFAILIANSLYAKDNLINKAMQCFSDFTNNSIQFSATASGDGYDIKINPKMQSYKKLFKPDAKIHISVDEGPIVTKPKFTIAKAGLYSSGDILNIFNKEIIKNLDKLLKKHPKYSFEGVVSFSNTLNSIDTIDPLYLSDKDATLKSSKILVTSSLNIDKCTGEGIFTLDNLKVYPNDNSGLLIAKNIKLKNTITESPINGYTIFSDNKLIIDSLYFKAKGQNRKVETNSSIYLSSSVSKIDDKHLKIALTSDIKALDVNTIALALGVKESKLNFELSGARIDGLIDFIKLSQELEKIQAKLQEAQLKGDDIELQKAIFKLNKLSSIDIVPIYNKIMIKDKTKVKLNWQLISDKISFIKLDLIYKANPVSGSAESALIELLAQNLAIANGDFEVKLDSQLVNSINPMAALFLDMLKTKGLITINNGVYHLKGSLKNGKIVINGKAYTLQELAAIMFS